MSAHCIHVPECTHDHALGFDLLVLNIADDVAGAHQAVICAKCYQFRLRIPKNRVNLETFGGLNVCLLQEKQDFV
jgi:hypothetical protein